MCAPRMSSFSMEQSSTNNKRSKITELFQGWVRSNGIIQNIKSIYIHFYLQKKRFNKNEQYSNIIKNNISLMYKICIIYYLLRKLLYYHVKM
jgi:hypothetical protein